jgi:fatty-acyl-CoA synthase
MRDKSAESERLQTLFDRSDLEALCDDKKLGLGTVHSYERLSRYFMNSNLSTFLMRRAQREPEKPALVFEGRTFSFGEFNQRSNRWASAFSDLGTKKGDRVAMLLANRNEFLEAFFGLAKIGAVLVPLNWRLTLSDLEHICEHSGAKRLIFGTEFSQTVETMKSGLDISDYIGVGLHTPSWAKDVEFIARHAHSEPKSVGAGNDPAAILYSSATTGDPKGVVRDHLSFLWLSVGLMACPDFRFQGRSLVIVPLYHGWGINFAVTAVNAGCTTVLMKAFDALHALETIREQEVDTFLAVPKMLREMSLVPNFETYLSSLRTIETLEALPTQLLEIYACVGITVRHGYGLTEAGYVTMPTIDSDAVKKPNSDGLPLFFAQVRVADEDGVDLPLGEVGEILVKSPTMMKEYWANPVATKEAIRDGWLHTGDLGKLDRDGCLYVVGRMKDVIRSGGENIYPAEVEKVLSQHPNILDVAAIGQPDTLWGERLCAIVRPREGASLTVEDIIAFCQGKLAHYKIPRELILTNAPLPRDPNGSKLTRKGLRARVSGS